MLKLKSAEGRESGVGSRGAEEAGEAGEDRDLTQNSKLKTPNSNLTADSYTNYFHLLRSPTCYPPFNPAIYISSPAILMHDP